MRKVLILAPYCSLPGEAAFNRFLYLAMMLSEFYEVTLVTSSFSHKDKAQRENVLFNENFEVVKIFEPGYSDNVSFRRVYSHRVFLNNFIRWFSSNKQEFDIVYSAYPLIGTNLFLTRKKIDYNYKLIIDVQDVWPEAIASAFPIIRFLPLGFLPFTRSANNCYKGADALIAVSKTYLERALIKNKMKNAEVIYIGSDASLIHAAEPMVLPNDSLKFIYCGSLGYSYDVETVIHAINQLYDEGVKVELHIAGSGMQEEKLKSLAKANTFFHGFIDFKKMISLMKACDVAVNSLVASAPQSVTNKLSDYLSVGIPILNSQTLPEVIDLLKTHSHHSYKSGDISSCVEAIRFFVDNPLEINKVPNTDFYRENSYPKVFKVLEDFYND